MSASSLKNSTKVAGSCSLSPSLVPPALAAQGAESLYQRPNAWVSHAAAGGILGDQARRVVIGYPVPGGGGVG